MKKKKLLGNFKGFLTLALVAILLTSSFVFKSNANALTSAYLYLSRMKVNITGAGADTLEYVLAFSTSQTIPTGGTVTLTFPDDDDGFWCKTAGALTVTGVTSSSSDLAGTNWAIDAALPAATTLTASCTKGSGAGSADKITISSVGAISTSTTYGVKLANGTTAGVLGTDDTAGNHNVTIEVRNGTVSDSSTFGIRLIADDRVVISATVSATPSVTCSLSTNTVNLGSLYPGGAFTTGQHTISTTTSDTAGGYYWAVYGTGNGTDAGLYKSSATTYLIPSTGSTTVDLRGVGTEGFGMTASDPDAASSATVSANFSDGTLGVFGALDPGVSGAKLLLSQQGAQTSAESSTITYGAKAGASAQTGSYQETVTFICGGYY
ncbi:MAG TPA: hypothetical protein PLD77_00115 [Candidatus Dojkabacteria bacterium]|nr:hypothetical protein [Candidatus Dojkabacteria bacterium]